LFILAANKQTVRLFGIDAPELGNCYAAESTAYLSRLLAGKKVQLREPLVDHFGRVVALVYVDGRLINEDMIRHGYAAYRSEPGSGKAAMLAAHAIAQTQKIGIYSSACTDVAPPILSVLSKAITTWTVTNTYIFCRPVRITL